MARRAPRLPALSDTSERPRPDDAPPFAVAEALVRVARSVRLLGAATPVDAPAERARLLADYGRGHERLPTWTYAAPHFTELQQALGGIIDALRPFEASSRGALYLERAEELRLEAVAAEAVGSTGFGEQAARRFPRSADGPRADALAKRWGREDAGADEPRFVSDERDPRSLASRLRAEVARRKLPFLVQTSAALSALAAVSGDTLWVAEGRRLRPLDVERTVLHEIEAHVLPRTRARTLGEPLFGLGTAGGSDDQEGYALWLEERGGLSDPVRRRELGIRHEAVRAMCDGADFVTVVRAIRARGVPLEDSLRVTERVFRGSRGTLPGLGRERVYLEAYVRVADRMKRAPDDETVLASGQVAVRAIDALRPWAEARRD